MLNLLRDARYSVRSLWRSKGFSIAVIATLALCIGANTTVFSVLRHLVLKPLPFEDSERIVRIFNNSKTERWPDSQASWMQYQDFARHADLFEGFALAKAVTKVSDATEHSCMIVTADFFDVMRVKPLLGRFFVSDEVNPGPGQVVVLTQSAWEGDYAGAADIIGKQVNFLNEIPYTIVGVAPRSAEAIDSRVRFFLPKQVSRGEWNSGRRRDRAQDLWARLKPGVSHEQGYLQLMSIERRAIKEHKSAEALAGFDSISRPFDIGRSHPLKSHLVLLQGGALCVLLVGCLNIVNLLLSRTLRRSHELATRQAFGAGRLALTRLMMSESMLLALCGAVTGSILTWSGLQTVNHYLTILNPQADPVTLSGAAFAVMLAITAIIAVTMGLLPIVVLWSSGRIQKVDSSARSTSAGRNVRALGSGFVVFQVATTLALLVGAGLLFRSYRNVLAVDAGFDASRIVTGRVNLNPVSDQSTEWVGMRQRIMASMREIPTVERVSYSSSNQVVGDYLHSAPVSIRGATSDGAEEPPVALIKLVDREFFATMGIPILEGRSFQPGDEGASYVVDQAFADRYLKGRGAIGALLSDPGREDWKPVVGVAGRANLQGLEARDGLPVQYRCRDQHPARQFDLLVRSTAPPESVMQAMRAKLREIDPRLHLYDATSLAVPFGHLHLERQAMTLLVVIFSSLALVLSTIGIYSVLAYDVQQRKREIGIRSALGAGPGQILTMVLRQGLLKTSLGLGMGLVGSLYLTRFLESQLFDITALDPRTYAAVIGLLLLVSFAASYLPARRAVKVDPMEALRTE